jgi:hypothetical protein
VPQPRFLILHSNFELRTSAVADEKSGNQNAEPHHIFFILHSSFFILNSNFELRTSAVADEKIGNQNKNGGHRCPPFNGIDVDLCPARGAGLGPALVVAIAAVDRLTADRRERHFGGHSAAVAGDADHRALARSAVAFARCFALVAAVLAPLGFIGETALCVERLFVFAEYEFLSAVSAD